MSRKAVKMPNADVIGPYAHAVDAGGLVFLSGQTPIDPATGGLIDGDMGAQVRQCFFHLFAVLKVAGMTEADVQKVNVFLTDMGDFSAMNKAYQTLFTEPFPARTTIGVASLPLGAKIEIEMIALKKA